MSFFFNIGCVNLIPTNNVRKLPCTSSEIRHLVHLFYKSHFSRWNMTSHVCCICCLWWLVVCSIYNSWVLACLRFKKCLVLFHCLNLWVYFLNMELSSLHIFDICLLSGMFYKYFLPFHCPPHTPKRLLFYLYLTEDDSFSTELSLY